MLALIADILLLVPILGILGAVLLLPAWAGNLILYPLAVAAFIVVPLYVLGGAVHAFCTAGRDHRQQMAEVDAYHRAILAKHAAIRDTPAPVRHFRLGGAG